MQESQPLLTREEISGMRALSPGIGRRIARSSRLRRSTAISGVFPIRKTLVCLVHMRGELPTLPQEETPRTKYTGKPPSSTILRQRPIVLRLNTTKKGTSQRQSGIRNERWSTRIKLTSLPRKPTTNLDRSKVFKCLLAITTDHITKIINELLSCTRAPLTLMSVLRKPDEKQDHETGQRALQASS